ncbi:hypothetical protein [Humidisolicoccus flavus]|uniref:hypothetical protein n=1 Tax=Humidisolicoccus flavus TaxID=3111414 RepID=UPI003250F4FE
MTSTVRDDSVAPAQRTDLAEHGQVPGRTRIARKALEHVALAASAHALGAPSGKVSVSIDDVGGLLGIAVAAPLTLASTRPGTGSSILDRSEAARVKISEDVASLTGYEVGKVLLEITSISVRPERKVQ